MSTPESRKTLEWQRKNPLKYKAKQAKWRASNRDHINTEKKKWRLLNPNNEKEIYTKQNHKPESLSYRSHWKRKHKDQYKEKKFLKEFVSTDGCCLVCGEINPFMLEQHHPFGKENPFTITLCSNHHSIGHRFMAWLEDEIEQQ